MNQKYYLLVDVEEKITYCNKVEDVRINELHKNPDAQFFSKEIKLDKNKKLSDYFEILGVNWNGKISIKLPNGSL